MTTFIVSVAWNVDTNTLKDIVGRLGESIHLFDNTFLLNTDLKSTDVRDTILSYMQPNDFCIYVSKLSRGSAWNNLTVSNVSIKSLYNYGED